MASLANLANLGNFDDFMNGSARQFNFDPTQMQEGKDILAQLGLAGITDAKFINTGPQGDGGNSTWQIDYDRAKLPQQPSLNSTNPMIGQKDIAWLNPHMNYAFNEGGENGGPGQFASYEQQSRSDEDGLFNQDLIRNDPTYGRYTPSMNVKPEETGWKETAWRYAPAAIMAIATLGAGLPAAAGMAGAEAAAGAGAAGAAGAGGTFYGMTAQQLASVFQTLTSQGRSLANGGDVDYLGTGVSLARLAGGLGGG